MKCRVMTKGVKKKRTFACKQNHWKPMKLFAKPAACLACCMLHALLLAALLQRCCGCCYDVVLLAFCWYTRISPGQGMQTVPLPHRACQTNSWMLHGCRCSLLWLLAFLFRESDAFFLSAPGRGRHRSRSPIDSGEKGGHVATVQQQQCLLPSHVRRRRLGQVCVLSSCSAATGGYIPTEGRSLLWQMSE